MLMVNVLARIIHEWLVCPILEIGDDYPLHHPGKTENKLLITQHSVVVKNKGKTAAKNCTGIVIIDVKPEELIQPFITNLPVLLPPSFSGKRVLGGQVCWAEIDNPARITINARDEALLDIYRVVCKGRHRHIEIPSERGWKVLRMALSASREYTGTLRVTAQNAKPVEKRFKSKPVNHYDIGIEFK